MAALADWAGESRVDQAVRRRRRAAWLTRQAGHETSLMGVLSAMGERARPVVVVVAGGRRHRGLITTLGRDVVGLAAAQGEVWVALDAVQSVRTLAGDPVASGPAPARTLRPLVRPIWIWRARSPGWPTTGAGGVVIDRSDEPSSACWWPWGWMC